MKILLTRKSVMHKCQCLVYVNRALFITSWQLGLGHEKSTHLFAHRLSTLPRGKFVYFFKMCLVVSEIYTTIFFAPGVRQSTETRLVTIRKMYTSDSACCNLPESKQDSCLFPWCHNFIKSLAIVTEENCDSLLLNVVFSFRRNLVGHSTRAARNSFRK